ncbi:MAG: hypothetical protein WA709_00045 [Stellaceae bacterium]
MTRQHPFQHLVPGNRLSLAIWSTTTARTLDASPLIDRKARLAVLGNHIP